MQLHGLHHGILIIHNVCQEDMRTNQGLLKSAAHMLQEERRVQPLLQLSRQSDCFKTEFRRRSHGRNYSPPLSSSLSYSCFSSSSSFLLSFSLPVAQAACHWLSNKDASLLSNLPVRETATIRREKIGKVQLSHQK